MYMIVPPCAHTHGSMHVDARGQLEGVVIPFHCHGVPGIELRLGSKHSYTQSHLTGLQIYARAIEVTCF